MSLNCAEIEKVITYFPKNGLVKKIFQLNKHSIIINIYDGKKEYFILGGIKDGYNRICLAPNNLNYNKNIFRFSQVLNSNINTGKLKKIYQFHYSRIVIIEIQLHKTLKKLIFRLWGNGSNILLLDQENRIIDCLRRMPKRGEWPNEIFKFPENINEKLKDNFAVRKEFLNEKLNDNIFRYYENLINNEENNKIKNYLNQLLKKEIKFINEKIKEIIKNYSYEKENLYQKYGELLKANLYKIKKGASDIEVDDFEKNKKIIIPLDIKLTPIENIKKYFNIYKKIKNARIFFETEKISYENRLNNLEKYIDLLNNINDNQKLSELENDIKKYLKINIKNKSKEKKVLGRHFILDGGYNAYVSRNSKESYELLKSVAKGNDYWFHIRDYPGSHVIVKKIKGNEIGDRAKIEASNLAIYYSKCKNPDDADVFFTQVKYLHKPKGGALGLVFPIKEKNIKLKYNKDLVKKILNR